MQAEQPFFTTETLWTIAVIVLILAVIKSLVLPRIASAIDKRARAIEEDVKRARAAREASIEAAADEVRSSDYRTEIAEAEADVQKMIGETQGRMQQQSEEMLAACKEDIETADAAFREEAEARRKQAMQDIRSEAAKVSADDTADLDPLDKQEAERMLNDLLAENESKTRKH